MRNIARNSLLAVLIMAIMLLSIQIASAAVYYTPAYANISENFILNVTVSAPGATGNISQVIIRNVNPGQLTFALNFSSNSTSTSNATFAANGYEYITWMNQTDAAVVENATNQSFYIQLNKSFAGAPTSSPFIVCLYNWTNTTVASYAARACDVSDPFFVGNLTAGIGMKFGFSGYVKIENGSYQNSTNITIYEVVMSANGPPTETPLASTLSDTSGFFRLWGINGSKQLYKVRMSYYNGTRYTKVGSNLPQFPSMMFYPVPLPPGMPEFKKMPTLNGSTFYLQPAATVNISAVGNTTPNSIPVKFGYEVIDQAVGFPMESSIRSAVWNKEVVVPAGRSYTFMAARDPMIFPYDAEICQSGVGAMNATACPAPPTSKQLTSANLTEGAYVNLVMNMSYSIQYVSGCIDVYGNSSLVNITSVIPRLVPWEGFVPPMDAKISTINITNGSDNLVYNDPRCPSHFAFYNLSLMGSSDGISYLLEVYAKNASNDAGNNGGMVDLAMFQNFTLYGASLSRNFMLRPLTGQYVGNSNTLNITKMKINIQNSSGSAITTSMHVEIKVKHPVFGTMHYIIQDLSNGVAYLPIINNSNWAKIMVFPNEAPPMEKTLNLSLQENNITVQVSEHTFRRPLQNGSLQTLNVSDSDNDPFAGINMTFYRNTAGCNMPNPPATCLLATMDVQNFNPLSLMVAGKVNLELKITATGTTLYFVNFDLLSAKPPTNSIMSGNASQANSASQTQIWEAGSFVPHVYDYAYMGMPYNTTSSASDYINESYSFNMSSPYFKDENWDVVWNRTAGDTTATLPDDYADYNSGIYSPLLSATGAACSTSNSSAVCYMNQTENKFWLKVPHFSGVG
ncbi:MAG: hypothetical protein ABIB71_04100, partial [Candidatus Woesearchaeota archaeon]